ncbi:CpsD/CapB family tyrosine-protein kinase [Vallitalea okinawensis]|uniref:CpsD/CapB family tyrosine-protein kinase n=1 Tax=Vallitalea okinawensis TaxID=2078660 RepID=UPI001A9A3D74|nr:CpsD/CapB family tyrosine-protein kinase [Vallitalea okinawensis]
MVSKNLIAYNNPKSPITEAYRMLRTNLYYCHTDKRIQTIVVTSPDKGEGKTTTGGNLALTIAKDGHKVLILDCDLRKPRVHKYFKVDNEQGITNMLVDGLPFENIRKIFQGDSNIHIVTSGPLPPNPAELLGSQKMLQFLKKLKEEYDYILIDAPPVGQVTDAAVIGPEADGVILTLASAQSNIHAAKRAKELLDNVGAKIIGTVLTKVDKSNTGYKYYSYYNYYGEEA